MHILLKDILKEAIENAASGDEVPQRKIQIYCDMDGVLVDLEAGFRKTKLSGGMSINDYSKKNGKDAFWNVANATPNFWVNLPEMPDARTLWNFIVEQYKKENSVFLKPVILSAGMGNTVAQQKTEWIKNHLGSGYEVMIAQTGSEKPNHIKKDLPPDTIHLLIDDTDADKKAEQDSAEGKAERSIDNITAWEHSGKNHKAIHHTNAANTIKLLNELYIIPNKT